jgi:hypothetical protein
MFSRSKKSASSLQASSLKVRDTFFYLILQKSTLISLWQSNCLSLSSAGPPKSTLKQFVKNFDSDHLTQRIFSTSTKASDPLFAHWIKRTMHQLNISRSNIPLEIAAFGWEKSDPRRPDVLAAEAR